LKKKKENHHITKSKYHPLDRKGPEEKVLFFGTMYLIEF